MPNKYSLLIIAFMLTACGGGGSEPQTATGPITTTPPTADNGSWQEATPESVGMDSALISSAFDEAFADGTYTGGALVIKDNNLVYERYRGILSAEESTLINSLGSNSLTLQSLYGSRDKDSLASSWSTAKSFVSVMVAIAIEQGFLESVDQSAADYIDEWSDDDRAQISIRNLLDMRSGLHLVCLDPTTGLLGTCNSDSGGSGGNLVYADNQMTACIDRQLAERGVNQPWYTAGGPYQAGYWVYSNCDTMVLGEILYRATGQDLQTYADTHLFSKIGMTAYWWRDNDPNDQVDGNYLAYCCLDATPRDFARFGQLLLNNGVWNDEQIIPASYIDKIKNIVVDSVLAAQFNSAFSYGLKFWTIAPGRQADGSFYPPANTIYSTIGFDGQYIMVDFDNNMVVVRNSIYYPALNRSGERKMKLDSMDIANSDFTVTLPAGSGMTSGSSFSPSALLYKLNQSINP